MSTTTDTRELVSNVKVGIDLEELLRQAQDIQSSCVDYSVSNASVKNMRDTLISVLIVVDLTLQKITSIRGLKILGRTYLFVNMQTQ